MPERRPIVLVDDEPSIVKMVKKRLEVEGYDVLVAMNGEDAIAMAIEKRPILIILDLMLPKIDGFAVCERLTRDRASHEIPIITIFSGRGLKGDEERCRTLGASAYVTKGRGAAPLLEQVNMLLGQLPRRMRDNVRKASEPT